MNTFIKNRLKIMFLTNLTLFGLIVTGIIKRETILAWAIVLIIYLLFENIENGTVFFVASIPFFIALPLKEGFDNFNIWRILSIILFVKWFLSEKDKTKLFKISSYSLSSKILFVLFILALLSIFPAGDKIAAIKRIIYFGNLYLIGIVISHLISSQNYLRRLVKSITYPTIIVVLVGLFQVIMTYFVDIYQFVDLWGRKIQCLQFGTQWCWTAVEMGNTWFAYYGEQLSLRVFSLFPDSHSFPIFVLLGLPALFAISVIKLTSQPETFKTLRKMIKTRVSLKIVWVTLALLLTILSGTRGIWAASLGVIIISVFFIFFIKNKTDQNRKAVFKYISSYLIAFYLLFGLAYPIFASPQFLVSKWDTALFANRLRSVINLAETSNRERIRIWQLTTASIQEKPWLGVGIGNFPVILKQEIELARAGSSAHNIYLHVAGEMGIAALIATLWFLFLLAVKLYKIFLNEKDNLLKTYWTALILYLPWVLIYSLTDVALFDERAFSLFIVTVALILNQNGTETT